MVMLLEEKPSFALLDTLHNDICTPPKTKISLKNMVGE